MVDPALIANANKAAFSTKEELMSHITNGRVSSKLTAVELNVVKELLPVYNKVQNAESFEEVLASWDTAMQGFENEVAWFGRKTQQQVVASNVANQASKATSGVAPVTSFVSAPAQESETPVKSQSVAEAKSVAPAATASWLKVVPANAKLHEVMYEGKPLFYCYVESNIPMPGKPGRTYARYTLVTKTEGRTIVGGQSLKAERIIATILNNLYLEQVKGSKLHQAYFEDGETLNDIKLRFNSLMVLLIPYSSLRK